MTIVLAEVGQRETQRPQWLDNILPIKRHEYFEQEANLLDSEEALREVLGHFNSLKEFARYSANKLLIDTFDEAPDADDIKCISRYEFDVDGRVIVQEDTRSLTDHFIYGLHDENHRAQVTFQGVALPAGLNQLWLDSVLLHDVRVVQSYEYRVLLSSSDALIGAMEDVQRNRMLLSAMDARQQGHISSDENLHRIERAVNGDKDERINGLRLLSETRALHELCVVGRDTDLLLYAPTSPGGQNWYECSSMHQLNIQLADWTKQAKGREYLIWRAHAADRVVINHYLQKLQRLSHLWEKVTTVAPEEKSQQSLSSIALNSSRWLADQENVYTPYGYCIAPMAHRQTFIRTQCELKALQTLAMREGGFESYEAFCFDLIKKRIEQLLLERGERIAVNPDHIVVVLDPGQEITLTKLISSETSMYVKEVRGELPKYPHFILTDDHATLNQLDIRDLAGWSRTLRPGEQYIEVLHSILDKSNPQGALKRSIHQELVRRQMKVGILQERFQNRLSEEQYQQLSEVIDNLQKADRRPTHPLGEYPHDIRYNAAFKLHIRKKLIVGVFVFRLVNDKKTDLLVFTPDAPDGRLVRPHVEFLKAIKSQGLGQYLLERTRETDNAVVNTYVRDMEELSGFNEGIELRRDSRVLDLGSSYDDLIYRTMSDVDEKTTSLDEIIFKLVFRAVEAAATAVAVLVPPVGVAMGSFLFAKNLVQGIEAYKNEHYGIAEDHFMNALIELVALGKAGYSHVNPGKAGLTVVRLLGNMYTAEKFISQATGVPRLHARVLEAIEEILQGPESDASKTMLL